MSGAMTTIGSITQIRADRTQISAFYRFAFPDPEGRAKKIAAVYRRSHRTAQKWLAGTAVPSINAVIAAALRHPKHADLLVAWIRGAPSSAELIARVDSLRAEIERIEAALAKNGGMNGVLASGCPPDGSAVHQMRTRGGSGGAMVQRGGRLVDRARQRQPVADVT